MTARKDITLGSASDAFLATLTNTPETAKTYGKALGPLREHFGDDLALDHLDAEQVADWFEDKWGQSSSSTWNVRRAALRAAVTWWQHKRWLTAEQDPAANLGPKSKKPVLPIEPLDEAEVLKLIAECSMSYPSGIRDRALIALMFRVGLRVGEALALECKDVNTATGSVNIRSGKGGKQRAEVMDDGTAAIVQRWLDKRKDLGLRANGNVLFCQISAGKLGDPVSYDAIWHMLRRRAANAGIDYKRIHPHVLRHSLAGELSREGVAPHVIREVLGHASIAVTDAYLARIAPAELRKVMKARKPFSETGKVSKAEQIARMRADAQQLMDQIEAYAEDDE